MAKRGNKEFFQSVQSHRRRAEKLLTVQASSRMKRLYDEAQGALTNKLRRSLRGGKNETFSTFQQRVLIAQLREGQALISQRLAKQMGPLSKSAQEASLKGLVEDVARLSKRFTGAEVVLPIDEAATFAGVVQSRTPSLMRMHQQSMARYSTNVVQKVEKELALTLLKGDSLNDAYDKVAETIDGEWWQGERIVRTEMSYAYNQAHRDGIQESAGEIPELMQQWQENCDESGRPMDDRVAVDSIAMHGQVAKAGASFTMPSRAPYPDAKGRTEVPEALVGLSWDAPPNRPNDRSVLSPWMEDWDVPGWVYRGGTRVWLVR